MRRTAGWQTLESKPDGRHLLLSTDALNQLARQIANPGSEVVETPLAAGERVDAVTPTVLQFTAPPSILEDRRTARRYSASQVHRPFTIMEGFCNSPTVLRDISTTGIRLVLRVQYRLRASLQLTIVSKSYGITGPVQAQVVRLVPLAEGRWLTSCVFNAPLDHEWLKTLIRNG
jgi:hypothetical protein